MEHSFNTGIAKIVGVDGAVIMKHLFYWVQKNYGNGKHFYDGSYWTYNSVRGFSVIFDYLNTKQINRILGNLIKNGFIKTGNYNANKMDRTMWYAFTEKGIELMQENGFKLDEINDLPKTGNAIVQNEEMHLPKTGNGNAENGKCNINIVTDIRTNNKLTNVSKTPTKKPLLDYSFIEDSYKDVFRTWLIYKRDTFKETYKTQQSLQAAYNRLKKLSGNSPAMAREIVEQSMANNWKGLFELKTINNNVYGNNRTTSEQREADVIQQGQRIIERLLREDDERTEQLRQQGELPNFVQPEQTA